MILLCFCPTFLFLSLSTLSCCSFYCHRVFNGGGRWIKTINRFPRRIPRFVVFCRFHRRHQKPPPERQKLAPSSETGADDGNRRRKGGEPAPSETESRKRGIGSRGCDGVRPPPHKSVHLVIKSACKRLLSRENYVGAKL